MRVLVLGANGMLGHKLYQVLRRSHDVWGTVRGDAHALDAYGFYDIARIIGGVDVEYLDSVIHALKRAKPDVVINAIGVVKQVVDGNDPDRAQAINATFPHKLAQLTQERGSRLIAISTDCVFSGRKGNYSETDVPDAEDVYGVSKRLGEPSGPNVLTIRTSIIGRELSTQHGLIEWFLANRGGRVKGYKDMIFSGLSTAALASVIDDVITEHPDLNGLYHISSRPISKYDLLVLLDRAFATGTTIEPSNEFDIDRSLDSSRFRAATGWQPHAWEEIIAEMAADRSYDERPDSGKAR